MHKLEWVNTAVAGTSMDKKTLTIICLLELGFVFMNYLLSVGLFAHMSPTPAFAVAGKQWGMWFVLWPLLTAVFSGQRISAQREDQAQLVTVGLAVLAILMFGLLAMIQEKCVGNI